jgi:hypothetical protein
MCQEQFEAEVQAEQYPYWRVESFEKSMAENIVSTSLKQIRSRPDSAISQWCEGRIAAVALIYPSVAVEAAHNEARFLAGEYAYRIRGML